MSTLIAEKVESAEETGLKYRFSLWLIKFLKNPWQIGFALACVGLLIGALWFGIGTGVRKIWKPEYPVVLPPSQLVTAVKKNEIIIGVNNLRAALAVVKEEGKSVKSLGELIPEYIPNLPVLPGFPNNGAGWSLGENQEIMLSGLTKETCTDLNGGKLYRAPQAFGQLHCYQSKEGGFIALSRGSDLPATQKGWWVVNVDWKVSPDGTLIRAVSDGEFHATCEGEKLPFVRKERIESGWLDKKMTVCIPTFEGEPDSVLEGSTISQGGHGFVVTGPSGGEWRSLTVASTSHLNCDKEEGLVSALSLSLVDGDVSEIQPPVGCFPSAKINLKAALKSK